MKFLSLFIVFFISYFLSFAQQINIKGDYVEGNKYETNIYPTKILYRNSKSTELSIANIINVNNIQDSTILSLFEFTKAFAERLSILEKENISFQNRLDLGDSLLKQQKELYDSLLAMNAKIPDEVVGNLTVSMNYSASAIRIGKEMKLTILNGYWGVSYDEIYKSHYKIVGEFASNGLAVVRQTDKYGFVDKNLNEVIPIMYNFADKFRYGFAMVRADQYYYINKKGKPVFKNLDGSMKTFSIATGFINPFKAYRHGNYSKYHGWWEISVFGTVMGFLSRNKANLDYVKDLVYNEKKQVFIGKTTSNKSILLDSRLNVIYEANRITYCDLNSLLYIQNNGKYWFSNFNGKVIGRVSEIPIDFDANGLAIIQYDNGNQALINTRLKVQKEANVFLYDFDNYYMFKSNGYFGWYIHTEDFSRPVIMTNYIDVKKFEYKSYAAVKSISGWGVINYYGRNIIPTQYDSVKINSNNTFVCYMKGKARLLGTDGNCVADCD